MTGSELWLLLLVVHLWGLCCVGTECAQNNPKHEDGRRVQEVGTQHKTHRCPPCPP